MSLASITSNMTYYFAFDERPTDVKIICDDRHPWTDRNAASGKESADSTADFVLPEENKAN